MTLRQSNVSPEPGRATPLREEDFHATKQVNFEAKQCCNFKNQCCFAIKQCIAVTDRIVLATKKTVGVTRITRAVRALPVSVAKKSINDALPVISETELIFIAGKQNLIEGEARGRTGNRL